MNDGDDDHIDTSLPPEAPRLSSPEPLRFMPWHKPRKHFVRVEQWLRHIDGIVNKLGIETFADGEPLRYLTLPGPDLLDVRMVAEYCSSKAIKLKYTGFCHAGGSEERRLRQNVSQFSLTYKTSVVNSSRVVRSMLQDVGVKNSEAAVELQKGGPFDVINIDACEPLADHADDRSGRLVDTIRSITEDQLKRRRKPWVLFLTTPIQADSISAQSMNALNGQVIQNTKNDGDFANELAKKFGEDEDLDAFLARMCAANGDGLLSVFSLGLSKWLIHLAEQAKFKVVKLKGFSYSMFRQEPFEPNMVSLCFLFEPVDIAISDNTGLTSNQKPVETEETPAMSTHIRALKRAFNIENLDVKLPVDSEDYAKFAEESKSLLRVVGYPVDDINAGYDVWLQSVSIPTLTEVAEPKN